MHGDQHQHRGETLANHLWNYPLETQNIKHHYQKSNITVVIKLPTSKSSRKQRHEIMLQQLNHSQNKQIQSSKSKIVKACLYIYMHVCKRPTLLSLEQQALALM